MTKKYLILMTVISLNPILASQVQQTEIDLGLDEDFCIPSVSINHHQTPELEPSTYLQENYPDGAKHIDGYDKSRGEGVPFRVIHSEIERPERSTINKKKNSQFLPYYLNNQEIFQNQSFSSFFNNEYFDHREH